MTGEDMDASELGPLDMFDTDTDTGDGLVCRVCGCLVAASGDYPKAHWDWHETPNGV